MNDLINAGFESMAGVFVFLSAWRVHKDREVRGVSAWMVVFMLAWGLWNLYYYPSLGQWGSFYCGLSVAAANITWISLILYYRTPR